MAALTLDLETYRDKVFGAWQGKSAGVTLGAAQRGQMVPGRSNFYNPVPGQPAASIALDFPLVWLHTLETTGPDIAPEDLAVAWLEHLDYSQDELGYAALNLRRGLPPPASGAHSNWFKHATGGVMRADLWALIAPGAPQVAASYAYHDAKLDHSEDGIWSAMFLAALASAAFFITDPLLLLTIGLAMMPRTCRTARAVKAALAAAQRAATWLEAREAVQHEVGDHNYTDAPQNMGFFTIGLFYGRGDFGSSLCAAVNCGYDSEVVGGALGAVLGIIRGCNGLPEDWTRPIGDLVIPGLGVRDFDAPTSITELTGRTVTLGRQVTEARSPDVALVEDSGGEGGKGRRGEEQGIGDREQGTDNPQSTTESEPADQSTIDNRQSTIDYAASPTVSQEIKAAVEGETAAPSPYIAPSDIVPSDAVSDTASTAPLAESTPLPIELSDTPLSIEPSASSTTTAPDAAVGSSASGETSPLLPFSPSPLLGALAPQPVSEASTVVPEPPPVAEETPSEAGAEVQPVAPDPVNAIAWADSARIKPLLVTPPNALVGQAGPFAVVMDMHDTPTIGYNQPKTLSFTVNNHAETAFSGRISLLAPPGWQITAPANIGQRQYIAAHTGTLRADFIVRAPEGQARIDIANAITLRFTPDDGGPALDAEFLLLGASCWWTVGPFANFDGEGFDRSYMPEDRPGLQESYLSRSMQNVRWEKQIYPECVLDLEPLFRGSSGVCYGQTILRSPTAKEARLVANTNSGAKLWLNGALVFRRFNRETFRPILGSGPWAIDVSLRAGDNHVMVKWVRGSEPIAFSLTVSDRFGRGLPEVGNTSW